MVVPPMTGGSSSTTTTTTTTNMRASPASGANGTNKGKIGLTANGNGHSSANMASLPISARRAQPLDMSTVERRVPTSKDPGRKHSRPHDILEAPIFFPSEEEFKDPFQYMQKIAPKGREYGIVKIVPPDGWNPDFAIDTEVRSISSDSEPTVRLYDEPHPSTRADDVCSDFTSVPGGRSSIRLRVVCNPAARSALHESDIVSNNFLQVLGRT
jgi:hypothetical protein